MMKTRTSEVLAILASALVGIVRWRLARDHLGAAFGGMAGVAIYGSGNEIASPAPAPAPAPA